MSEQQTVPDEAVRAVRDALPGPLSYRERTILRTVAPFIGVETRRPDLSESEQEVMDHLLAAMNGILRWKPRANTAELTQAVHVIQGFIVQHMLIRLAPDAWSNWYDDPALNDEERGDLT